MHREPTNTIGVVSFDEVLEGVMLSVTGSQLPSFFNDKEYCAKIVPQIQVEERQIVVHLVLVSVAMLTGYAELAVVHTVGVRDNDAQTLNIHGFALLIGCGSR